MTKATMAFDDIDRMKQETKAQVAKKCEFFERLFAIQSSGNARHLIGSRIVYLKGLLVEFAETEHDEWRHKLLTMGGEDSFPGE